MRYFLALFVSILSWSLQSSHSEQPFWTIPVQLDCFYATSTAIGSDVHNLLDQDPKTIWKARPGAGLDEGIYFRFAKPISITGIETKGLAGAFDLEGGLMDLAFDGKWLLQSALGTKLDLTGASDGPITELYLRITHTNKETSLSAEQGPFFQPSKLGIGLESLKLFGDKGQELHLIAPTRYQGSLTASSHLQPMQAYHPENLCDGHLELAWVEGNLSKAGEEEKLTFVFEQPVQISALKIWNGYQRSPESFSDNARLNAFEFGVEGSTLATYALKDGSGSQLIKLKSPLKGTRFTLFCKTSYPGKKFKDMALSELVFYDTEKPFTLSSKVLVGFEKELLVRLQNSPLQTLLDRGVRSTHTSLDKDYYQLFTLRRNGTFTLFNVLTTIDEEETVSSASGHWELLETNTRMAKVKIVGVLRRTTLKMTSATAEKKIINTFSEELLIDGNNLQGQKVVFSYLYK